MSGFSLKLIALICMTIDHFYKLMPHFFQMLPSIPVTICGIPISLTGVFIQFGRLAFPIFAFLIAEGCLHTRSLGKYLKRLLIFAVISEFPFDFMFKGTLTFSSQNVMWTFLLGVLAIYLYERLKPHYLLSMVAALLCAFISFAFRTDYRGFGVVLIFAIYISRGKPMKLMSIIALVLLYYSFQLHLLSALINGVRETAINKSCSLVFTLLSVPILALYNGQRGIRMKWFFYIYYPLHILALGCLDALWT